MCAYTRGRLLLISFPRMDTLALCGCASASTQIGRAHEKATRACRLGKKPVAYGTLQGQCGWWQLQRPRPHYTPYHVPRMFPALPTCCGRASPQGDKALRAWAAPAKVFSSSATEWGKVRTGPTWSTFWKLHSDFSWYWVWNIQRGTFRSYISLVF